MQVDNSFKFINSDINFVRSLFVLIILLLCLCIFLFLLYNISNGPEFLYYFVLILLFTIFIIISEFLLYKKLEQNTFNTEEAKQYDEIIIKPKSFLDIILYGKNGLDIQYIKNTEDIILIDTYEIINDFKNQYIKLSDNTEISISENINKDYIYSLENKECSIHYIKNKKNNETFLIEIKK